MEALKCPRCGQLIPGWQPVHLACLAFRLRGWLVVSSAILLLAGGFLLVRVIEVRGFFEPQAIAAVADDSDTPGAPLEATDVPEVAGEDAGVEPSQARPSTAAAILSTAEATPTLPPSPAETSLRPSPTKTATRLSPTRQLAAASTGEATLTPEAPSATTSTVRAVAQQDEIVFQSNRDGDYEIYIMAIDGTNQRQLTVNTFADRYPRVSPDGRQIVFQSRRNNNTDIFVIDRDGGRERQLTFDTTLDELPSWSPDGTRIVFNSWIGNNSELFVVDVDGSNLRRLTDTSLDEAHASWSPNGRLAFNGTILSEGNFQLYTAEDNGEDPLRITDSRVDEHSPEWSPDGARLLFVSERDNSTNPGIYVMDAGGQNARLLYNGPTEEWGATWSADGSKIIFTADQPDGTAAIYVMDADGDNPQKLTDRGGYPSWARAIASEAKAAGQEGLGNQPLEIAPLTGSGLVQLSSSSNDDYTPALSPDQRRLVFSSEINGHWALVEGDVNGDGGELKVLAAGRFDIHAPDFSPDGLSLLVSSNRDGDMDIYQLDALTGEFIAQLTDLPGDEYSPHWLPDGSGFVFSSIDGENDGVYVEYFGGSRNRLAGGASFNGFASPSPDGRHITFYSGRDGDFEVYIMDIDGQNQIRLTRSSGRDAPAGFSPDGEWIAFESDRADGNYELYIMRTDGSDVRRLTSNFHGDWFPTFSPDGKWLLFQSDQGGNMNIYRMSFAP